MSFLAEIIVYPILEYFGINKCWECGALHTGDDFMWCNLCWEEMKEMEERMEETFGKRITIG